MQQLKIGQAIQQGEVYIKRVASLPTIRGSKTKKANHKFGYILAHSESGNHHILTGGVVEEKPLQYQGLQEFMVTLQEAQKIIQDASNPHETHTLPAGFYEIRICREFNPYSEVFRPVTD